jgi:hypothetical protein
VRYIFVYVNPIFSELQSRKLADFGDEFDDLAQVSGIDIFGDPVIVIDGGKVNSSSEEAFISAIFYLLALAKENVNDDESFSVAYCDDDLNDKTPSSDWLRGAYNMIPKYLRKNIKHLFCINSSQSLRMCGLICLCCGRIQHALCIVTFCLPQVFLVCKHVCVCKICPKNCSHTGHRRFSRIPRHSRNEAATIRCRTPAACRREENEPGYGQAITRFDESSACCASGSTIFGASFSFYSRH